MEQTTDMLSPALNTRQLNKNNNPTLIIGALFFVFGFVTWLNSVLIPYLKIACGLSTTEAYLVKGHKVGVVKSITNVISEA